MRWIWLILCFLAGGFPGGFLGGLRAETLPSDCIALAANDATVVPVRYGAPLAEGSLRIRYLDHSMFALETPGGLLVVTDYNGKTGNPDVVPAIVTMNNYHDTHFTDQPDPRIPVVIRGWGPLFEPPAIDLDLDEIRIRNVTTDLRGPFGEGARQDGNSIFIFEAAGLCIVHLGHLHQELSPERLARIGRVDVLMVPVDGAYTMDQAAIAGVVRSLNPRIVLPMHWFTPGILAQFLTDLGPDYPVRPVAGAEIEVSRTTLPVRPEVVVLAPALFP